LEEVNYYTFDKFAKEQMKKERLSTIGVSKNKKVCRKVKKSGIATKKI
jgi:hypothetical protein